MPYDTQADTLTLRKCSPYKSKSIVMTWLLGLVLAAVFAGVGLFEPPTEKSVPKEVMFAISLGCVVASALLSLWISQKSKRLILSGEIVDAEVRSVMKVGNALYRVLLVYDYDGKEYKRAIYADSLLCGILEGGGECRVVVLPDSPSVMSPLHEFGKFGHIHKIASGEIGLAESHNG